MSVTHILRHFKARPRLISSVALGAALWLALPSGLGAARVVLSFDLGGLAFLGLTWAMMARATPDHMRRHARLQDEGKFTILILTVGAALFSIAAIGAELHDLKDLPGSEQALHVGVAAGSIVCSWLVTHTMFALHYAHTYYGEGGSSRNPNNHVGGLQFPSEEMPDYWDFLYFSFVIGMTAQTSDVQVGSRLMRRLALAHGVLSFFFNTVILALSINIAASLL